MRVCARECSVASQVFVTLWSVGRQAPLSMEFSGKEYWGRLPFPTSRNLPDPRIKSTSLAFLALAGEFFSSSATWAALLLPMQVPYTCSLEEGP